jgi:hypothetical protein
VSHTIAKAKLGSAGALALPKSAQPERKVGREALESSSPGFQPGATPSQLPTQFMNNGGAPHRPTKKPGVFDTGPWIVSPEEWASVTSAMDARRYSHLAIFVAGRNNPRTCVLGLNWAAKMPLKDSLPTCDFRCRQPRGTKPRDLSSRLDATRRPLVHGDSEIFGRRDGKRSSKADGDG